MAKPWPYLSWSLDSLIYVVVFDMVDEPHVHIGHAMSPLFCFWFSVLLIIWNTSFAVHYTLNVSCPEWFTN